MTDPLKRNENMFSNYVNKSVQMLTTLERNKRVADNRSDLLTSTSNKEGRYMQRVVTEEQLLVDVLRIAGIDEMMTSFMEYVDGDGDEDVQRDAANEWIEHYAAGTCTVIDVIMPGEDGDVFYVVVEQGNN